MLETAIAGGGIAVFARNLERTWRSASVCGSRPQAARNEQIYAAGPFKVETRRFEPPRGCNRKLDASLLFYTRKNELNAKVTVRW